MCHFSEPMLPPTSHGRRLIVAALSALGFALMALLVLLPNRLTFAANVDIGVAQTGSPASPVLGAPLTYTVVVTNGATPTDGPVLFTDTLPANVTLAGVTTTLGTCVPANPVTCTLGPTLAANATVTVTIAVTPSAAGPANNEVAIAVTAADADTFAGNDTSSLLLTVGPTASTTTITSDNPDPSVVGQPVTVNFTVNGPGVTPTGPVTITVSGGPETCTGTLNAAGSGSCSLTLTSAGSRTLTASYGGDANYLASSDTEPHSVNQANTAIALTTSGSPTLIGQSVTFTATVTAQAPGSGTPTGTVTFYDGGNVLGSNALSGAGVASLSTAGLSLGTHTITATYTGSANYNASTSSPLTQQVNNPVPVLTSLSPPTTTAGASSPLGLTLNGANFVFGAEARWNGAFRTAGYVTTTELLVTIPITDLAFAGVFSVTAVNPGPGGGMSNALAFTVTNPIPTVTSLSQNTAIAGGPAFALTVNGINFVNGPYPSVVLWNNAPLATTFVSASQLTATVTAANIASAGVYTVTVANPQPDGTRSLAQVQNFTVTNPTLSLTLSPLTLLTGRTASLTVSISGVQAANRTINLSSSNPGVAAVPANVTLPANTASVTFTVTAMVSGTATVTAALPPALGGGTASANVTVNNPVPSITSLSPVTTNIGGPALTLTVNGADFVNGSVVRWAGSNLTTSFVNSTQLTATVPAANLASVGTFNITVFNPPLGGGLSNAAPFTVTYPVPTLMAISPVTATAGNLTTTLTLTGSNFVTASVVRWGESNLSTTFVSSTRLTAVISATLLTVPGPVEVRVFNPEPGGGRSAPQTFTVVSQTPLVRLGASSYVVGKNGGAIAIPVQQLSPIITQTVTVTVATVDGTALAGRDYTAVNSRLVFPPGTFVQTVTVPILDNTFYTGNRQFTVLLSEPVNTLLGNPSTASVTIAETNARTGCTLYRNSTSLKIPDGNPAGAESVMTLSSPNVFVDNLSVRVESLQHTFISDLSLTLIAPDGRRVTLFNRFGGAGHNLLFTVFQDGGTPFTDAPNGAPYTGTFNPASSLGVLRGTPVSGAWRLHVSDNVFGDEGELRAWSLDICGFTSYRVYLPFVRR